MPADPDDDDSTGNTIVVKNEGDSLISTTHRPRVRPSSRSPADDMSPGRPEPAGLADAARAAATELLSAERERPAAERPSAGPSEPHARGTTATASTTTTSSPASTSSRRRLLSPEPLPLDDRPRGRPASARHSLPDHSSAPHHEHHDGAPESNGHARDARPHARGSTSTASTASHRPLTPTTATTTAPSNKRPRSNVMTTEERLMAMPEKRPMPWRPGVDPGADIETGGESRRKQIRFGCLLATRGDVVPSPCASCANGRGKFSLCVADPTLFRGACAGCQLSGRPNRCSIKQGDDSLISPNSTPEVSARNVKKKLSKAHQSPLLSKPDGDQVPAWHNGSPKWPQQEYTPPQQQPEAAPQTRWATVNAGPAAPPQKKQRGHKEEREQRQEQRQHQPQPSPPQPPQPPPQHNQQPPPPRTNGIPITLPPPSQLAQAHANPIPSRSPMAWATVNPQQQQRPPNPVSLPSYPLERSLSNGVGPAITNGHGHNHGLGIAQRNGTPLASFPAPLQRQPLPLPHQHRAASREPEVLNANGNGNGVALIDTLPKTKQRQVYGVISGLQAGIEQLQRELGALKKSLGVGDED